MTDNALFNGLEAVVQYRRRGATAWITMAAFDFKSVANDYAVACSAPSRPWEYRVVSINSDGVPAAATCLERDK